MSKKKRNTRRSSQPIQSSTTATASSSKSSKSAPPAKSAPPERGLGLMIWLVVISLQGILSGLVVYSYYVTDAYKGQAWVIPVLLLLAVLDIVGVVGVWLWRNWGIYLYGAVAVAHVAVGLLLTGNLIIAFHYLLYPIILAYLTQPKAKHFR